jgi:hypothetical protein
VRWTVKCPAGVGIATSPFCNQSNNGPMVLSGFATYPSSDMMACACTLLTDPPSEGALVSVDVHDDATGERRTSTGKPNPPAAATIHERATASSACRGYADPRQ